MSSFPFFLSQIARYLVQKVFLKGSQLQTQIPGFADCSPRDAGPILPPKMPLRVFRAADPSMDAWHEMATFAQTGEGRADWNASVS
ncbi:hypothetical protein EDB85DRAFT_2155495 [Lactarius pseudohatsudake]|nr:hypothetical protein EDB85DRAFT_2155495 [Lactarius pseudohatsudake]